MFDICTVTTKEELCTALADPDVGVDDKTKAIRYYLSLPTTPQDSAADVLLYLLSNGCDVQLIYSLRYLVFKISKDGLCEVFRLVETNKTLNMAIVKSLLIQLLELCGEKYTFERWMMLVLVDVLMLCESKGLATSSHARLVVKYIAKHHPDLLYGDKVMTMYGVRWWFDDDDYDVVSVTAHYEYLEKVGYDITKLETGKLAQLIPFYYYADERLTQRTRAILMSRILVTYLPNGALTYDFIRAMNFDMIELVIRDTNYQPWNFAIVDNFLHYFGIEKATEFVKHFFVLLERRSVEDKKIFMLHQESSFVQSYIHIFKSALSEVDFESLLDFLFLDDVNPHSLSKYRCGRQYAAAVNRLFDSGHLVEKDLSRIYEVSKNYIAVGELNQQICVALIKNSFVGWEVIEANHNLKKANALITLGDQT